MAWKDDQKNYRPPPGKATEPGTRGVRSGEPPLDTVRSVDPRGARSRGGYTRSEMPVLTDGQLGDANLDAGPEPANPEGSIDISNGDYLRVENAAAKRRRGEEGGP